LIASTGYDGLVYGVGPIIGWPVLLFLVAEPLRNLGRFTVADMVSFRLKERPTRILVAANSLVILLFYLVIQMVGAGQLIQLLFGLPYMGAVSSVAVLVLIYVLWGGMLGTTWLQIIKAALMLTVGSSLAYMVLRATGFSLDDLLSRAIQAHPRGASALAPSKLMADPIDAVSLGVSLTFGLVGLPHILTRLFTVKNGASARKSVFYATTIIAYFYTAIAVIGAGAVAFVIRDPRFLDSVTHKLIGGSNMAAMHLSDYFGGHLYLGFLSALAFAMILAVVSGLTISGASIIGHDLYTHVRTRSGSPQGALNVSRIATVALIALAVVLSQVVQHLNVAFLIGLAFSISASTNFPILMLSLYWRGLTTRGVLTAGITGLVSSIALLVTGPTFWVGAFGFSHALFPYENPALFSMTLAFASAWLMSVTDRSASAKQERLAFDAQLYRSMTGVGAADAVHH
jgi:cation/acetate symporter